MKLQKITFSDGSGHRYNFFCPGCKCMHGFEERTGDRRPSWQFNGDMDKPTFTPSLLIFGHPSNEVVKEVPRCHLFLRDGVIEFLSDCEHDLRGQKVPLPEIPSEEEW